MLCLEKFVMAILGNYSQVSGHFESHNSVLMSVSCYCLELFDVFVMVNIVRMLHSIEPRVYKRKPEESSRSLSLFAFESVCLYGQR